MAKKKTTESKVQRADNPNVIDLRGAVLDQHITETLDSNYMP